MYQREPIKAFIKRANLQLTCPYMRGRVIDQTSSEITLDTTDQVVVLGVCTLAGKDAS